jgi:hypothetical protein
MTSHKPLKSVSHNFGHSFISLMNYVFDDYLLGHLLKQARTVKINKLRVDLINNHAEPKELLTDPITSSINRYCNWFPNLVKDSGSTMDFVISATMTIEFDLENSRPHHTDDDFVENPFSCEVIILDDQGKEHRHKHSGWWFPETKD